MFMDEIWVAIIGLVIALAIVGFIHWLIVGHVNIGSDTNKVILSLEVVAFVCLMATFVLGELFKIAESVMPGRNAIAPDVGLTWHDTLIVLGTLLGSLLIYKAITYLLK
jgi:hypothetical protein